MVNKWIGIGRLGADPEVRTFDSGDKVANFSIACSEQWKDKDGNKKENTDWINVAVFGKLAEIIEQYVKKGSLIYLEGKLQTRSYESNGERKYVTEVVLRDFGGVMKMLGSKSDSAQSPSNQNTSIGENPGTDSPLETDDLPF